MQILAFIIITMLCISLSFNINMIKTLYKQDFNTTVITLKRYKIPFTETSNAILVKLSDGSTVSLNYNLRGKLESTSVPM